MGRVDYTTCKGIKRDGSTCTKPGAKRHSGYCSHHKNQFKSDTKPVIDKDQQIAMLMEQVNRLQIENNLLKSLVK